MVAVIIINYNASEDTIECLNGLNDAFGTTHYRIVLIDNASVKPIAYKRISQYVEPENYLLNTKNTGFAGAVNQGIRHFDTLLVDYYLLLNNDTFCPKNSLHNLVEVATFNPEYTIWSPTINYYNNRKRHWQSGFNFKPKSGRLIACKSEAIVTSVDSVPGTCMLINAEVVKSIGFLDECFFMYYEETDYCLKALKAGYKAAFTRSSLVYHKSDGVHHGSSLFLFYYLTRNHLIFLQQYQNKVQFAVTAIVFSLYSLLRSIKYIFIKGKLKYLVVWYLAIKDFLVGKRGRCNRLFLEA